MPVVSASKGRAPEVLDLLVKSCGKSNTVPAPNIISPVKSCCALKFWAPNSVPAACCWPE